MRTWRIYASNQLPHVHAHKRGTMLIKEIKVSITSSRIGWVIYIYIVLT